MVGAGIGISEPGFRVIGLALKCQGQVCPQEVLANEGSVLNS